MAESAERSRGSKPARGAERPRYRPHAKQADPTLRIADPDGGSPYLIELRRLGAQADRGETVDSTGMTDDEFLEVFVGR